MTWLPCYVTLDKQLQFSGFNLSNGHLFICPNKRKREGKREGAKEREREGKREGREGKEREMTLRVQIVYKGKQ